MARSGSGWWDDLRRRPQRLAFRRLAFQVHVWCGLLVGLYMLAIGLTGAVLVFKSELEHRANPELYPPAAWNQPAPDIAEIVRNLEAAYPDHRLASIFAPVDGTPVYVAYLERDAHVRTVYLSANAGAILGERPETGLLRWIQALHVNLLTGPPGRLANGIGGLLLLVLCITGLISWWPGVEAWRQRTLVRLRGNWRRTTWELHGATGFWTVAILAVWGFTGAYFIFPDPVRAVVSLVSPVHAKRAPVSHDASGTPRVDLARLLETAAAAFPGTHVSGLVLPGSPRGSLLLQLSSTRPAPIDATTHVHLYFDQFSGELLEARHPSERTAGTAVLAWLKPLHFGNFGGLLIKVLWAILGIAPPLLFMTGLIMWWNRVGSRRLSRRDAPQEDDVRRAARSL